MEKFELRQAKHVIFCNQEGKIIGEGILIRYGEEEFEFQSGGPVWSWLEYHCRNGKYRLTAEKRDCKFKYQVSEMCIRDRVTIQADKEGIADDAVSAVTPDAVIYLPLEDLVDIAKEIERLEKEEKRLTGELARVNGMLSNEKFLSKAPESKIQEEKEKLAKYAQMMDQVKARLSQLK